jgi:hypothetical protein
MGKSNAVLSRSNTRHVRDLEVAQAAFAAGWRSAQGGFISY